MLLHPANNDSLLANSGGTRRAKRHRLVLTVLVVCAGSSAQFGFATGCLNNLEPMIHNARLTPSGPPVSLLQWSLIVGGFGIGGLLGALIVHGASERLGHRKVLLVNNAFVLAASALMAHGTTWWVLVAGAHRHRSERRDHRRAALPRRALTEHIEPLSALPISSASPAACCSRRR